MPDDDPAPEPPAESFAKLALASDPAHSQPSPDDIPPLYRQPSKQEILHALQLVYHPREPSGTAGAANCLNALLQGPYFEEFSLSLQMGTDVLDSYHLNFVLERFNLSLEPLLSARAQGLVHHEQNAFLLLQHRRWFTVRRFGKHWINLNDAVKRPCQILPAHLGLSLSHLQQDGCTAFIVRGTLPACQADDTDFFERHFLWNLSSNNSPALRFENPDQVWDGGNADDMTRFEGEGEQEIGHYPCVSEECAMQGVCNCGALSDDELEDEELELEAYEQNLQAAIEMSILEMQRDDRESPKSPIKPLCIKKDSPPTSTVSSEPVDGVDALRLEGGDVEMSKEENQPQT